VQSLSQSHLLHSIAAFASGALSFLSSSSMVRSRASRSRSSSLRCCCFNISDGMIQAGPPSVRSKDTRTLKDASGQAFGADIYNAAQQEGKFNEVSYVFPKPGATDPSPKTSFVTMVGELGCGVGYYK
jgi:Cache domain